MGFQGNENWYAVPSFLVIYKKTSKCHAVAFLHKNVKISHRNIFLAIMFEKKVTP